MTREEYLKVRRTLTEKFNEGMAALETVWGITNGQEPPPTVEDDGDVPLAPAITESHHKGADNQDRIDGRKLRKAKRLAKEAGKNPKDLSDDELMEFLK